MSPASLLHVLRYSDDRLREEYLIADRTIMWILLPHMLTAIAVTSQFYSTYTFGILASSLVLLVMVVAYLSLQGTLVFRLLAALALMLFSTIYIQQHLGRIEMHFHVFIGLAILTIYKDVRPMLFASAFIIVHHIVFNWLQASGATFLGDPIVLFNYGCGMDYVYLHAWMVIAEAVVLTYIIHASTKQYLLLHEAKQLASRESDKAKRAELMKSNFLANMSHEIRTPINGITGFTNLLKATPLSSKQLHYANIIKHSTDTLLGIINDILDFSKIENRSMQLDPVNINPFMELESALAIFTAEAHNKDVEFSLYIDPGLPECLVVDALRLKQVLNNLIGNALKFTMAGGFIKVRITAKTSDDGKQKIAFEIADSGIGIPKARQRAIFDAFTQADSSTTRQFGGTGLGLNISASLVSMMGGTLEVQSEEGVGSTFFFTLTLPVCHEYERLSHRYRNRPIALCLDDKTLREYIETLLTQFELPYERCTTDLYVPSTRHYGHALLITDHERTAVDAGRSGRDMNVIHIGDGREFPDMENVYHLDAVGHSPSRLYNLLAKMHQFQTPPLSPGVQRIENMSVLVAEDYDVNQELIGELLNRYNITYVIVENGLKAVERALGERFDLVLMDINMPVMNGIDATKRLREAYDDALPIVALTANALEGDRERFLDAGMNDYLSKPIDPDALEVILRKYAPRRRQADAKEEHE